MPNHRIRLAGPWESQSIDENQRPVGESIRAQLPFALSKSQNQSGIQLTRGFHRPTGIDNQTTLRIVLQASASPFLVQLNGSRIAECDSESAGEYVFSLGESINDFNQLSVLFATPDTNSAVTLNTAWLEIRSPTV